MAHFVFVITIVCLATTVCQGVDTFPDPADDEVSHRPIPCQQARQCLTELGIHSNCVKRLCVCVNGSRYLAGDTPTCFKSQPDVGGKCESTAECRMTSAECKAQTCECLKGFVAAKDKSGCLKGGKLLGEPCEIDEQCESKYSGDVTCLAPPTSLENKVCSCSQGHTKNNNRCYKKKSIGESCENDFNCEHIQHSTCDQLCTCFKGFVTNSRSDGCLPVATEYESQCEENIQCSEGLGDDVMCIDKHCDCKSELEYDHVEKKCKQIEDAVKEEPKYQKEPNEEAVAKTDMTPSLYPSMEKSDSSASVETRISSILFSTSILLIQFI